MLCYRTFMVSIIAIVGSIAAFSFIIIVTFWIVSREHTPQPTNPITALYEEETDALMALVQTDDLPVLFARLDAASHHSLLSSQCHALAHEAGHAAYERNGFSGALARIDDVCGSGYIHGIIEAHFAGIASISGAVLSLCGPTDYSCIHGLGHGLMFYSKNEVPWSVAQCGRLGTAAQRIHCSEGVFMENFEADEDAHPSAYLYPDDPFFTCAKQAEPYRGVCAFYVPRYVVAIHPDDLDGAVQFCLALPRPSAEACIKGVGSEVMKERILAPRSALDFCQDLPEEDQALCMEGALSYLVVHFADWRPVQALCPSLDPRWLQTCEKAVAEGKTAYPQ